MFKEWFAKWRDWTGDKDLTRAIHNELRRQGYAIHAANIRDVRLAAIQRPGWVQVYRFTVETHLNDQDVTETHSLVLSGVSRNDGRNDSRSGGTQVLLTTDPAERDARLEEWSEGMIRRR